MQKTKSVDFYAAINGGFVYLSTHGLPCTGEQLPPSNFKINIINYHKSRGVMNTSIHLYRHTFATMYLKNGGDIHILAKLLGHSSLKQVQTYLSLTNEDIRENFNNIN